MSTIAIPVINTIMITRTAIGHLGILISIPLDDDSFVMYWLFRKRLREPRAFYEEDSSRLDSI
ncbi:MAG: hypothetical protein ACFE7R_08995 [Candidatus Hodarchaeota archaeon]